MTNGTKEVVVLSEGHNLSLVRKIISDSINNVFSAALHHRLTGLVMIKERGEFIV